MRRRDYLLGHAFARLGFLVLEAGVLLGAGLVPFGVPLARTGVAGGTGLSLGALSFAGLALLVASRVRTIEALSGLMNLIMLPMWIVSGVFFSSANFPDALQPVIRALPLTALNDALRAVLLEGQPLPAIAPQVTVLATLGRRLVRCSRCACSAGVRDVVSRCERISRALRTVAGPTGRAFFGADGYGSACRTTIRHPRRTLPDGRLHRSG